MMYGNLTSEYYPNILKRFEKEYWFISICCICSVKITFANRLKSWVIVYTYSTYATVSSRLFGNYVAEKFSKDINGISANLLAGLFENKYIDIIEHYQQSLCHHFLLLYSMSC